MNNTDGTAEATGAESTDGANTSTTPEVAEVPEVSTPSGELVPAPAPGDIATTDKQDSQGEKHGERPAKRPKQPRPTVQGSFAGGTWVALIAGCLLLILLLVFILQNQQSAELNFFSWHFQFPSGVGFLLSAIAGALIMALVGGVRMLELRRQVKKEKKLLASREG